jgi:hypothetical protein
MGGKTTTSTNKVEIPKEVLDRYNAVNAQASKVAQNPFQQYGTQASDFVAQFNPQQFQGIDTINQVAGMGPAYESVDKYMNPYIKNVADTTRAQMEQANEQAQSGALGTAIQSGAFGGDRAGVAAANLANQQNLAMGSTMANIYGQGYDQAVSTSMADANRLLGVAGAQLGAGTQMQQTEQAGKDALINQFQQQMGYPFQVAQFLANIAMGTGALSGSTTTSTQQGSFFSDRRLKHDIKEIGTSHNGLPIYTFKYKGDPESNTHVGFMADEVEKKNPEAVGLDPSGYKTVDYDKATHSMGGGVAPRHSGEAFAAGGVAGPYGSQVGQQVGLGTYVPQAYLPVSDLMIADPNFAAQHADTAADVLAAAANTGKSLSQLDETFGKGGKFYKIFDSKAYGGGVTGGYAGGGMVQPQKHSDYLSGTLAAQEAGRDKPELKTAQPPERQESGLGNVASALGSVASIASIFSDRRLKHSIKEIGKTHNGLPIYTFKYKGDDKEQTHVGFMADEVESKHPEAVGQSKGMKTVDYSQAHKFADGGVAGARRGYADGSAVRLSPEEIAQSIRATLGDTSGMQTQGFRPTPLARSEAPAQQPAGLVPDARPKGVSDYMGDAARLVLPSASPIIPTGVVPSVAVAPPASPPASPPPPPPAQTGVAPLGTEDESARAYRAAAANRFNAEAPTGVAVPVSAPVDGQTRPMARPEGLGMESPTARPMPRPERTGVAPAPEAQTDMNDPSGFFRTKILPQESGGRQFDADGNPLTSPKGAVGIAQVMEGTGPEAAKLAGLPWDRDRWLTDSDYNATIGEAYFMDQYRKFGSLDKAAAAYNAGPGALRRAMEKAEASGGSYIDYLPEETRNYVASTTGFSGSGEAPTGGLKPYEDRNFVGKIMRNEDGTMNRDAMLSVVAGIGDMLASPSPFLLPSIGAGLSGAANTYMAREGQVANINAKNIENMGKLYDLYNKFLFTNPEYSGMTLQEFAEQNGLSHMLPKESDGAAPAGGITLQDTKGYVDAGNGIQIPFMSDYASLTRLANEWKNAPEGTMQRRAADAAEAKLAEIETTGYTTGIDGNGQAVTVPVESVIAKRGSIATDARNVENTQEFRANAAVELPRIAPQMDSVDRQIGIYSKTEAGLLAQPAGQVAALASALGINIAGFNDSQQAALVQEALKDKARGIMERGGGGAETDFARSFIEAGAAGPNLEPDAVKKLLAIEKASLERERDRLTLHSEWQKTAENPYDLNAYEAFFAQNYPLSGYTERALESMPKFVGETGSEQKPYPKGYPADQVKVGDYFTLPDGTIGQRTE